MNLRERIFNKCMREFIGNENDYLVFKSGVNACLRFTEEEYKTTKQALIECNIDEVFWSKVNRSIPPQGKYEHHEKINDDNTRIYYKEKGELKSTKMKNVLSLFDRLYCQIDQLKAERDNLKFVLDISGGMNGKK